MNVIFLDRDGVINEYPGKGEYVKDLKNFKFIKGSKEAIALLTKHDYDIYVVSNQAGVAKGLYTKAMLNKITKNMLTEVKEAGGRIKKVLYCIHSDLDKCECRKPKIGLFLQAVGNLGSDFRYIYFIGDDKRDVQTGRNLGCKTILLFSGRVTKKELHKWEFLPDRTANNLLEAVKKIVLPKKSEVSA